MSQPTIDENGITWYHNGGERHRVDGPAMINNDGTMLWFRNNKNTNDNGPCLIMANGSIQFRKDGVLDHERLPSIIKEDGTLIWYKNGLEHRDDDLPSKVYPTGSLEWRCRGKLHREGAPAAYHHNRLISWCEKGYTTRENAPAIIFADGKMKWMKNSEYHRNDGGPAVYGFDFYMHFYTIGDVLYIDTVTMEENKHFFQWFVNGKNITDDVFSWVKENDLVLPFTKQAKTMCFLRFCNNDWF